MKRIDPLDQKSPNKHEKFRDEAITSLRLPIFNQNKPYAFFKINTTSDKYRLSLSPEFLKQFNLSFRIFRNESLTELLEKIGDTSRLNANFGKLDFRLPKRELQEVIKQSIILDINDDRDDVLNIDKYIFICPKTGKEETSIFIVNREYKGIENVCLSFVSKKFLNIEEFLRDLDSIR